MKFFLHINKQVKGKNSQEKCFKSALTRTSRHNLNIEAHGHLSVSIVLVTQHLTTYLDI